jgi:deazaflavin-dependent oxidoreductase (nitroreductase family)
MDETIRQQLLKGHRIDITTIGRKSGKPHRIEIGFQNIGGTVYLSGSPGRRDWYANLVANPEFTFHLKGDTKADLPAHARPITDPVERRVVLTQFTANWNYLDQLDAWVSASPLVEVGFDDD